MPAESAKRLRWYDNADLAKLAVQQLQEKQQLLDTIAALRQVWCGLQTTHISG
jgi:hypothetical protein